MLNTDELSSRLRTKTLGRSILVIEDCLSTNTLGLQLAACGAPHGFTIVSARQTRGRGRRGRLWLSPEGGIWMSVVLKPESSVALDGLPMLSALATVQAINSIYTIRTLVRWPNDVVLNGRKLAGSLVETKLEGETLEYAVVGLGVNVNFPSSLLVGTGNSTTISDSIGSSVDIALLTSRILFELERFYENMEKGRSNIMLNSLRRNDFSKGRRLVVELQGERVRGIFQDHLSLTTALILDDQNSTKEIETSAAVSVEYLDA